jgi:uncharacterized membrane protein YesL
MQGFASITGILYRSTEWIMRFSVINILWFSTNLPIFFILLMMYVQEPRVEYSLPLALLFPLLFFPSTIAMFASVRDWVMKKEQQSLTKAYFSYLKSNYKMSFLSGLFLLFVWFIWLVDYYFFKNSNIWSTVFLIVGPLLFVYTMNFFSLSVHYQMSRKALIKNAFFVTVGSPFLLLCILMSNFLLFYLSAAKFLFLLPLFTGSISAYISFLLFYRFSLKVKQKATP